MGETIMAKKRRIGTLDHRFIATSGGIFTYAFRVFAMSLDHLAQEA
jgi:hypothetical protein